MKKLRFVIWGCGRIAQRYAEQIAQRGELVAVCNTVKKKADELAAKYNAAAYYRTKDLFRHSEADLNSLCTPNGLHAAHSIEALLNGFHVLCEKPMAIRVTDRHEMIRAAAEANRRLFIVNRTGIIAP